MAEKICEHCRLAFEVIPARLTRTRFCSKRCQVDARQKRAVQQAKDYRQRWGEVAPVPWQQCWCGCGEETSPAAFTVPKWGTIKGQPQRFIHNHHTRVLHQDAFTTSWACSEAGAWFLGLWTADGHLTYPAHLGINLTDRDAVLLAADSVGYPRDRVAKSHACGIGRKDQWRFRVGVQYLLPRLNALGITPGPKTVTAHAPDCIAFDRHFWRGVIDGDGWISPKGGLVGLVSASRLLAEQFATFTRTVLGFEPTVTIRREGSANRLIPLYQLGCTGQRAFELAHLLYEDLSKYVMVRKLDSARRLIDRWHQNQRKVDATAEQRRLAIQYYKNGLSGYEIQRRYGIPARQVYYHLEHAGVPPRSTGRLMYQTHCKNGHPLSGDNLRMDHGRRRCVICTRATARRSAAKKRST